MYTASLLVNRPVHSDPGVVADREPTGYRPDDLQGRPFRVTNLYQRKRRFAIGQDFETCIVDMAGGARRDYLHDHF